MKFDIESAKDYSQKNRLQEWVFEYLHNHGNNKKLARVMNEKGFLIGPIDFDLSKILKIAGYEDNVKYKKSEYEWELRVDLIVDYIKKGHKYPPLIVWYKDNVLQIADGNHRYDAFLKLGIKSYPIIIWFKDKNDYLSFKKNLIN